MRVDNINIAFELVALIFQQRLVFEQSIIIFIILNREWMAIIDRSLKLIKLSSKFKYVLLFLVELLVEQLGLGLELRAVRAWSGDCWGTEIVSLVGFGFELDQFELELVHLLAQLFFPLYGCNSHTLDFLVHQNQLLVQLVDHQVILILQVYQLYILLNQLRLLHFQFLLIRRRPYLYLSLGILTAVTAARAHWLVQRLQVPPQLLNCLLSHLVLVEQWAELVLFLY